MGIVLFPKTILIVTSKTTDHRSLFCSLVAKSCPALCHPMDRSTPGSPVLHRLPGFARPQHARLPCPSPSPGVCSTSCPLRQQCYPTTSPSATPSPPAFSLSQHQGLFSESALCIRWPKFGASASATESVLPMDIQSWFPFGLTRLVSMLSMGLSRVFSSTTIQKHQFFGAQPFLRSSSHIHTWPLEEPQLWQYRPLLAKRQLCFLIPFATAFLPRSEHLLNFTAALTIVHSDFGTEENKMLLLLRSPLLFAIANIIMKKFEILGELPKCDTEMKWANIIGKMALVDLLDVGITQILLVKKKWVSAKCNQVRHNKTRYVRT